MSSAQINTYQTSSLSDLQKIAKQVLPDFLKIKAICLYGPLGTGKTTFTKLLGQLLKIPDKIIKSPSYVLSHHYPIDLTLKLIHFDLYRLQSPSDLENIGLEEALADPDSLVIIEWADRLPKLPEPRIDISLDYLDEKSREIKVIINHSL